MADAEVRSGKTSNKRARKVLVRVNILTRGLDGALEDPKRTSFG